MTESPYPGLLSPEAADLYAHLVEAGTQAPDPVRTGTALIELERLGLVAVARDGSIDLTPPAVPLGRLLDRAQRDLLNAHRALLDEFTRWTRAAPTVGATGTDAVTVLHRSETVESVADALVAGAVTDLRSIDLPVTASACARMIFTAAGAARCPPVMTDTVDYRMTSDAPPPMIVVHDVALLAPRSESGSGSALLIRAPALVSVLARHFDLLWERAEPMPGHERETGDERENRRIPRTQQAILTLLMAGLSDDGIARSLAISDRSVRRHIAALEERAGVTSRFALGARAVRLGWLPM